MRLFMLTDLLADYWQSNSYIFCLVIHQIFKISIALIMLLVCCCVTANKLLRK
jgi:hypothetical protein